MKLRFLFLTAAVCLGLVPALAQVPAAYTAPKGYLIGPGDVLTVKALGEKDFEAEAVTVDDDGKITIPWINDPVPAGCKTERELQADVAKLWSQYLKDPQINVRVTQRNSRPPIHVIGEVAKANDFTATRTIRLLEVLSATGGPTSKSGGMVQLIRTRPPMCADAATLAAWNKEEKGFGVTTRIYSLASVSQGSDEANPEVLPGDIVNVPKAAPFYVTGEVLRANEYDLPAGGLPLSQAIAMAGGKTREAKIKDVKIYRRRVGATQPEVLVADLNAIKEGKQKDIMLEPYDIVEIGKAKKSIGQILIETLTNLPNRIPIPIP
jgi:polysaccharide export outer membrane protein